MKILASILFAFMFASGSLRVGHLQSIACAQGGGSKPSLVNTCAWELDDGTRLEARAERVRGSGGATGWRVTVRNPATGALLLSREISYLNSIYVRDLNADGRPELIIDWDHGVCCSSLEIYEVDAGRAREILNEAYRADAALIDLSGDGEVDVLISTAKGGALPTFTTRYVWQGERYRPAGSVPYKSLVGHIKRQFDIRGRR